MSEHKPVVVGIAGGTGSGKTTVARKLAGALGEAAEERQRSGRAAKMSDRCVTIEHDGYYRDQSHLSLDERATINYDHPSSLDTPLLVEHLRELRAGRPVQVPSYDFATHTRRSEMRTVEPARLIIIEGILVFTDAALRELMDVKIFVDTDADIRLMRRIRRDLEQRGRTFQSVRDQYYATVRPMHIEYVEPSKRWADLIIPDGGNNRVAIDVLLGRLARAQDD